jgi:NADP-dependent aldehyde dehydrogenase
MTVQTSFNPRNGLVVPAPAPDTPEAVDAVVATAVAAAEPMAAVPPATRAGWLTAIAGAVEADAEPLAALAAGCPVVVKAHPAHPRLSARLAEIAGEAMAGAGVTTGPFGIVHGFDAGTRLVSHPAVRAVGFTGSLAGGLALWRLAASRPEVIPVYAEMGTVNTVVVTPSAAAERPAEIAAGFVSSFTLGMGQFCTKPGLLTEAIAGAYHSGLDRLASAGGRVVAQLPAAPAGWAGTPTVLAVDAAALTSDSPLLEECFGPVALVAEYGSEAELASVLAALPGSLAAGVHAAGEDDPQLAGLVATLSKRCGRVVVNGWPTGVALGWAQQHGGPWPATSAPWVSSVGAAALSRRVCPVAFQDVPAGALPAALRDDNPWRVPRRVDGVAA